MSEIEWIEVGDSERIVAMAYDEESEVIYVRFPDGVEWLYEACPPPVWDEFTAEGQSKGRYIFSELNHKPNRRHG
ncbi:MAG TPA: KTSC domain-containing protein [Solirubrobacterales bacterium]